MTPEERAFMNLYMKENDRVLANHRRMIKRLMHSNVKEIAILAGVLAAVYVGFKHVSYLEYRVSELEKSAENSKKCSCNCEN